MDDSQDLNKPSREVIIWYYWEIGANLKTHTPMSPFSLGNFQIIHQCSPPNSWETQRNKDAPYNRPETRKRFTCSRLSNKMGTEFGTGNLSLQAPDLSTAPKIHLSLLEHPTVQELLEGEECWKGEQLSLTAWFQGNTQWAALSPRKAEVC